MCIFAVLLVNKYLSSSELDLILINIKRNNNYYYTIKTSFIHIYDSCKLQVKGRRKKGSNIRKNPLFKDLTYQESGQRRFLFRRTLRNEPQSFEEFYTYLLELAAKAFPEKVTILLHQYFRSILSWIG